MRDIKTGLESQSMCSEIKKEFKDKEKINSYGYIVMNYVVARNMLANFEEKFSKKEI